jgi:hypothetical protein
MTTSTPNPSLRTGRRIRKSRWLARNRAGGAVQNMTINDNAPPRSRPERPPVTGRATASWKPAAPAMGSPVCQEAG